MGKTEKIVHRREFLDGIAATVLVGPLATRANAKGPGLSSLLGRATGSALDTLAACFLPRRTHFAFTTLSKPIRQP